MEESRNLTDTCPALQFLKPIADKSIGRIPVIVIKLSLALCLVFVTIFVGLLDVLPPIERDELIHHLAIPKIWLNAGEFVETPWAAFSYFPMNIQLLYLVPLALDIDWATKFVHHFFGLLTALLVFLHLRRRVGATLGLAGALIFLSTPLVMRLGASAYVDLGLTFFIFSAVYCLIRWRETGRLNYFILSALALGFGLGVKYQGFIGLPILTLGVAYIGSQSGLQPRKIFLRAIAYAAIALLVVSPWLLKNYVLTGNPTYPLFSGLWGVPGFMPENMNVPQYLQREFMFGEGLIEYLLIPIRMFFQGQDFSPRYFDGVLNPMLLLLPAVALFKPRFQETGSLATLVGFWLMALFLMGGTIARYLLPVLPVLSILSVYGLVNIARLLEFLSWKRAAIWASVLVLTIFLSLNASWAWTFWSTIDPWPYISGRETREEFLTKKLEYYPTLAYLNQNLSPDARVLLLFTGSQGYYCEREYFYSTWFAGEILRSVIEQADSAEAISKGVSALGATHIVANDNRLIEFYKINFEADKQRLLALFHRKYLHPLFRDRGYALYRIDLPSPPVENRP